MGSEKLNWTLSQNRAISTDGRDVLVTASAGTGKTAVLSERCARLLGDTKDLTDVSQILVLTFTNPAAQQMHSRIAEQLRSQPAQTNHLRRQLLGLDAAHISTIHSFCRRLITEHFYLLGIDPTFRVIDADEQMLLKAETLTQTIETAWADSSLAPAMKKLLHRRSISGGKFLENIIKFSEFLDSTSSRTGFYERASELADLAAMAAAGLEQQRQIILKKLTSCKSQLQYAQLLEAKLWPTLRWSQQIQDNFLTPVDKCIELIETERKDDFEKCVDIISSFTRPKFANKPKEMLPETAGLIKAPAEKAIKSFRSLGRLAIINPDYERIVAPTASLQTKVIIELVKRFDRAYAAAKKTNNCLDFADLQRLMLRLLTESDATAEKLRKRFKYILVDEYQDINPIQQKILEKLSRDDNVFVVGDIKQSIYAFRQARPEIFLKRLQQAVEDVSEKHLPVRVDLSDNFRSRKGILDFANAVFARIMTTGLASIDYDTKIFLKPTFEYKPQNKPMVEMYILDEQPPNDDDDDQVRTAGDRGTEIVSSTQRQAAFIAERIKEMVGTDTSAAAFKVYDKQTGSYRPVQYRDIVILIRSLRNTANDYVELLQLAGIPISSQSSTGYFATTEIADCISLLKVLDNPQQDIELAAVLRSPFFNITDTQLAMIRIQAAGKKTGIEPDLYERMIRYSQNGTDKELCSRLEQIIGQIEQWRTFVRRGSLADLVWKIYRSTGYLSFVSALPNGKQRRANLLKMHDRAIQFEGFATPGRCGSLARFVDFIEKLLDTGQDWAPAGTERSAENAVRIMSIHKSKGLEFPVVFLAELNQPFNFKDSTEECIIDEQNAIGLKIIEPQSNVKLPDIAHQVIAEKKTDTTLAEEMRILYVAITRARERLILTASKKCDDCIKILSPLALTADEPLRDWQLRDAGCCFDWLVYGLANHSKLYDLFGIDFSPDSKPEPDLFSAKISGRNELDKISNKILRKKRNILAAGLQSTVDASSQKQSEQLFAELKQSLNWQYPFKDLTALPAKTSVSKLTHRDDEFARLDFTDTLKQLPKVLTDSIAAAPAGLDRKLIGTATHLVLSSLDLSADVTTNSISQTIEKLISEDKISAETAAAIDIASIEAFFRSDLGLLALQNPVMREWPFTFALSAVEFGAEAGTESIILQGIIDMIIKTPQGLVIIDFKTDRIRPEDAEKRAELYTEPLNHYSRAAKAILKSNSAQAWLYFLHPHTAINVSL